jgi:hypothetical protein
MPVTYSEFLKQPQRIIQDTTFLCERCGSSFSRTKKQVADALRFKREKMYCSEDCRTLARVRKVEVVCETCEVKVLKSRANLKRSAHHFCSTSCAARFSNRATPKRVAKQHPCRASLCSNQISIRRKFCKDCRPAVVTPATLEQWLRKWGTLGDLQQRAAYQVHAHVRWIARMVYRVVGGARHCKICFYDKHIDVCHIREICDFPSSAPIAQVNHPNNLVGLCKNHHWELDHGQLSAEDRNKLDEHIKLLSA